MVMTRLAVGCPVDGRDGPLGTVAGTRSAPTAASRDDTPITISDAGAPADARGGQYEYVLVQLSRRFGLRHTTRLVPVAWVRPAAPDAQRVTLDATRAQVVGCPPLRTDEQIHADVAARLAAFAGEFHLPDLHATVRNGVVRVTGHTLSLRTRQAAISCAWEVPGVLGVQDQVVDDETLTRGTAPVPRQDPAIRAARLPASAAEDQHVMPLVQAGPGVDHVPSGPATLAARPPV